MNQTSQNVKCFYGNNCIFFKKGNCRFIHENINNELQQEDLVEKYNKFVIEMQYFYTNYYNLINNK